MIENHPCYGCSKAKMLFSSPTAKRKTALCKIYRGVIKQKCTDFPLYSKKPKEN